MHVPLRAPPKGRREISKWGGDEKGRGGNFHQSEHVQGAAGHSKLFVNWYNAENGRQRAADSVFERHLTDEIRTFLKLWQNLNSEKSRKKMENILEKSMTRKGERSKHQSTVFGNLTSNLSFFIDEKLMEISDFDTFKVIRWIHENGKVKLTLFGDEELKETKSLGGETIKHSTDPTKQKKYPLFLIPCRYLVSGLLVVSIFYLHI